MQARAERQGAGTEEAEVPQEEGIKLNPHHLQGQQRDGQCALKHVRVMARLTPPTTHMSPARKGRPRSTSTRRKPKRDADDNKPQKRARRRKRWRHPRLSPHALPHSRENPPTKAHASDRYSRGQAASDSVVPQLDEAHFRQTKQHHAQGKKFRRIPKSARSSDDE